MANEHLDLEALPDGSFASSVRVRKRMQDQRARDTAPELALRSELHRHGLRYRLDRKIIPGTQRRVDIVFGPSKVAVFVDGCFWHGCPVHGSHVPSVNQWYWPDKIAGNKRRDADTNERLSELGWAVVRIWEHEDPAEAAIRIADLVRKRRTAVGS